MRMRWLEEHKGKASWDGGGSQQRYQFLLGGGHGGARCALAHTPWSEGESQGERERVRERQRVILGVHDNSPSAQIGTGAWQQRSTMVGAWPAHGGHVTISTNTWRA